MSTTILAIESSCDETAAAVVVDGKQVKSNVIYSQIELHKMYGGVVPEIASRKHVEKINQVIQAAIDEAQVTWDDIDAVVIGYEPALWMNRLNLELLDIINPFVSCVSNSIQIRGSEIVEKIIRTNIGSVTFSV